MAKSRSSLKLFNAALDVVTEDGQEWFIARGVLTPRDMTLIQADDYQREVLSRKKINSLKGSLKKGRGVPDVVIGMRGETVRETTEQDGSKSFYLQDSLYVVDGLQRITAGIELVMADYDVFHLGAKIYFGTTEEWERVQFHELNAHQTRLNANITLRNLRKELSVMEALYRLSGQTTFIMYDRVTWSQNMARHELVTANTFCKAVGWLHGHMGPGHSNKAYDLAHGLQKIGDNIGNRVLTNNVKTFFDTLDKAWGIKRVEYKAGAKWLKLPALLALAKLFSDHTDFWDGDRLVVQAHVIQKLATFKFGDPAIAAAIDGNGSSAVNLLVHLMVEHINSGKRTRRLTRRTDIYAESGVDNDVDDGDGESDEDGSE